MLIILTIVLVLVFGGGGGGYYGYSRWGAGGGTGLTNMSGCSLRRESTVGEVTTNYLPRLGANPRSLSGCSVNLAAFTQLRPPANRYRRSSPLPDHPRTSRELRPS